MLLCVSIDFPSDPQRDAPFHRISFADWDGLCDHLRDVLLEDIFKHGVTVAASKFCE